MKVLEPGEGDYDDGNTPEIDTEPYRDGNKPEIDTEHYKDGAYVEPLPESERPRRDGPGGE